MEPRSSRRDGYRCAPAGTAPGCAGLFGLRRGAARDDPQRTFPSGLRLPCWPNDPAFSPQIISALASGLFARPIRMPSANKYPSNTGRPGSMNERPSHTGSNDSRVKRGREPTAPRSIEARVEASPMIWERSSFGDSDRGSARPPPAGESVFDQDHPSGRGGRAGVESQHPGDLEESSGTMLGDPRVARLDRRLRGPGCSAIYSPNQRSPYDELPRPAPGCVVLALDMAAADAISG